MDYNKLIEENMGLVISVVNSFGLKNETDRQDLIDAGRIGLWKAISKYDENTGNKISTYAVRSIKWFVIRELKRQQKNKMARLPKVEALDYNYCVKPELWEALSVDITDEEKQILEFRASGYKLKEISEMMGLSYNKTKMIFYEAVKKVKEVNEPKKKKSISCN